MWNPIEFFRHLVHCNAFDHIQEGDRVLFNDILRRANKFTALDRMKSDDDNYGSDDDHHDSFFKTSIH